MKFVTDASELAEWEQLDDAELVRRVRDGIKGFRTKDAAGSGLGARELEENDQPRTQDDPPPTPGTPRPPERGGPTVDHDPVARAEQSIARDVALEDLRIRERAGYNMDGELLVARARRSAHVDVTVVEQVVPGYGRLK